MSLTNALRQGGTIAQLAKATGLSQADIQSQLMGMLSAGTVVVNTLYMHAEIWSAV
jgi:hypothetical protein